METTRENIDEITRQVGYEDTSTFRRLFKKYTALSPRDLLQWVDNELYPSIFKRYKNG